MGGGVYRVEGAAVLRGTGALGSLTPWTALGRVLPHLDVMGDDGLWIWFANAVWL